MNRRRSTHVPPTRDVHGYVRLGQVVAGVLVIGYTAVAVYLLSIALGGAR